MKPPPSRSVADITAVLGHGPPRPRGASVVIGLAPTYVMVQSTQRQDGAELIRYFGNDDPTSRRLLEELLAKEEEHAEYPQGAHEEYPQEGLK